MHPGSGKKPPFPSVIERNLEVTLSLPAGHTEDVEGEAVSFTALEEPQEAEFKSQTGCGGCPGEMQRGMRQTKVCPGGLSKCWAVSPRLQEGLWCPRPATTPAWVAVPQRQCCVAEGPSRLRRPESHRGNLPVTGTFSSNTCRSTESLVLAFEEPSLSWSWLLVEEIN